MSVQLNKVSNNPLCMIENRILTIQREGSALVSNLYIMYFKANKGYITEQNQLSVSITASGISICLTQLTL